MILSREQEAMFIEKYDKLVWSTVHHFKRRANSRFDDNTEDLYQEAMIVLIKHIRRADSLESLNKIPIRDMINAMCVHVLTEQVVSFPKRTTDFSKRMTSIVKSTDYTYVDIDERYCDMSIDDSLIQISFDAFERSLDDESRKIVALKLKGLSNREVARALGISDVNVTRELKKIKAIYMRKAA